MEKTKDIDKTIYLTCICGCHVMQVNCFLEFYDTGNRYNQEWNFAFFDLLGVGKPSLWYRIKFVWKYLRGGEMHNDHVILSEQEADKLVKFIRQNNFAKCIKVK